MTDGAATATVDAAFEAIDGILKSSDQLNAKAFAAATLPEKSPSAVLSTKRSLQLPM